MAVIRRELATARHQRTNDTEGHDVANDGVTDFRGGGGDAGLVGLVIGAGIGY